MARVFASARNRARLQAMWAEVLTGQAAPGDVDAALAAAAARAAAVAPPAPVPVTAPDRRPPAAGRLLQACQQAPARVDEALAVGDFRRATGAVWAIVAEANRYAETVRPWELARAEHAEPGDGSAGRRLDAALAVLVDACRTLAAELSPFLPAAAATIVAQCDDSSGHLPSARPLFPRIG